MQEKTFRDSLISRGMTDEDVNVQISFIKNIEEHLKEKVPSWELEDLNPASVQWVVNGMIDRGENTIENLQAFAHYGKAIQNDALFLVVFQLLDGYEAMDNLYEKLGELVGGELRDTVFEDLPLPPLGLSRKEKSRYTYRVMTRLEEIFEERTCQDILKDSLRDLPDDYYRDAKQDFYEACEGHIDRYLIFRGEKFLAQLIDLQSRKELFFGQEITDDVLAFVRDHPQIGQGIREGNRIIETKIPYNTKAYLAEQDPELKRYHYCHCPWVRDSFRKGERRVPALFCQCSAGFHKKPYEVIFGQALRAEVLQSVLNGDPVCQFVIYLPEELNL